MRKMRILGDLGNRSIWSRSIGKRKDLHRAVSFVCVLAMCANPFSFITYADGEGLTVPEISLSESSWSDSVEATITGAVPAGGKIEYRVDDGTWIEYDAPADMTEEGEHTIYARIEDGEGAQSGEDSAVYQLDKSAPVISVSCDTDGASGTATTDISDMYSGVFMKKYAQGSQSADYFKDQGTVLDLSQTTFSGTTGEQYTVYAEDNCGNTSIKVFNMNTAPTVTGAPVRQKMEPDSALVLSFSVEDKESAATDLEVTVSSDNAALFPDPFVIVNSNGSCTATATPAGMAGSATVTIRVSDGEFTDEKTVSIVPNSAPVAVNDAAGVDENASVDIAVLGNDTDVDDDALTIIDVVQPAHGTTAVAESKTKITYTPTPEWNGEDTFTYVISDTSGATASAVVTVTVNPITEGPQISLSTTDWSDEVRVTLTGTVPTGGSIQYRIGDGSWQTYSTSVLMTEEGENTVYARILKNSDGIPTKTTSAIYKLDQSGPDISASADWDEVSVSQSVPVTVTDTYTSVSEKKYAEGSQNIDYFDGNGEELADSFTATAGAWYTLYAKDSCGNKTVFPFKLNTKPEITDIDDNVYGTEDHELSFTFTVSDNETDPGSLSSSVTSDDTDLFPNSFEVTNNSGTCTAKTIPGADLSGNAHLTVTVSDGTMQISKTITAYLAAGNDAPVAVADSATTEEDTPVTIDVLDNDTDVEGDEIIITEATGAAFGTVEIAGDNKSVVYTPAANYNGNDSFSYTIKDPSDATSSALVSIEVTPVNDAPIAVDDSTETNKNVAVAIDALANDSDVDAGDTLIITSAANGSHGTAAVTGGGLSLTYTPDANWYGTDTISYEIADTTGATAAAIISVKVNYLDYAPPVADLNESYDVNEDNSIQIDFQLFDAETSNQSITAQVTSSDTTIVKNENIVVTGLGDDDPAVRLSITPEANKYGTVTITIKASDGFNIATYTFLLNVLPVNDVPVARNDSFTFIEDYSITFSAIQLLANDADIDGDALSVAGIVTNVSKGTLNYDAATGIFTYTPELNAEDNVTFTYRISDGTAESLNTGTVTLNCTAVNDEPWLTDVADDTILEDGTLSGVDFQIGDPETDAAQLVLTAGSSDLSVVSDDKIIISGTGSNKSLTIIPNPNGNGKTTISLTVSDGEYYVTKTFELIVTAVQDPPTALDDIAVVRIGNSVIIPVLDNDFDVDGDTITVSAVSVPLHGTAASNGDGTVSYTANSSWTGIDTFSYTINDGNGNEATAEVKIQCNNLIHAPILSRIADQSIEEDGTTGVLSFKALDLVDLSSLVLTKSSSNTSVIDSDGIVITKINDTDYTVQISPVADQSGASDITITAEDTQGSTYSISFHVMVYPVNDLPAAADDLVTAREDESVEFNVLGNDSDVESTVSVIYVESPSHGQLISKGSGTYQYIPFENWNGTETIDYVIMDQDAAKASAAITIQVAAVNDAPTARDDYSFATDFSSPTTVNVLHNDSDVDDGDSIHIISCSDGAAVIDNVNGTITFSAVPGFTGTKEYTYTIEDEGGLQATARVILTTNSASGGFYLYEYTRTIQEDSGMIQIDLSDKISNYTGGALTLGLSSEAGKIAVLGTASVNGDMIEYTPGLNNFGTDSFYYTVSDGSTTKEEKIIITILPVNDVPTITSVSGITVNEDEGIPDVTVTIGDVDNDISELIFAAGSSNQSALRSDQISVERLSDGTVTLKFSPDENANGLTTIFMKVSDGVDYSETSFDINITSVNDNPSAIDISKTLQEDTYAYINLIEGQTDPDIGDTLTAVQVIGSGPQHGTVTIDGDGIAYYTPDENYNGTDAFQYQIVDSAGADPVGTVSLTITPVYDPTEILNLASSVITTKNVNTQVTFDIPNPDNAEISVVLESKTLNLLDTTTDGAVTIQKVGTHYTALLAPVRDATGNTQVVVKANDGTQTYAEIFTLYVGMAVGDVTANDDSYTIAEDTKTSFNVIGNDTDSEGDSLSVISFTNPQHGTVINNMDGTLSYDPVLNYNGSDSFQYVVTDPHGNTAQATVSITITPVNDPPTARTDSKTIEEDTPFLLNVLTNDSDVEGDPITLVSVTQPSHGSVTFSAITGEVSYTPSADYNGSDSFTYTISDGELTSIGTVLVTIAASNDPPAIADISQIVPWEWEWELYEDSSASFGVRISDAETANSNLLIQITSTNKTLIADNNIKLTGTAGTYNIQLTPSPDKAGTLKLKIMISDGVNTTEQQVNVTVYPVNDAPSFSMEDTLTVNEDCGDVSASGWADNISKGPSDEVGQNLTFNVISNSNEALFSVLPSISSDGTLAFRPASDAHGSATITVNLKDDGGIDHGGADTSENQSFTIIVNPVNDVPSFTKGADQTVAEDSGQKTVSGWAADIYAGADNESGQVLNFVVTTTNSALFSVQPAVSPSGELTFTPAPDANGTATVNVKLYDDGGTDNSGVNTSAIQTFTITVTAVNDNPGATADSAVTLEDTAKTIDVLANDTDVDKSHEGDTLTIESVTDGAHGTVTITEGGVKVVYTPEHDYNGGDSFTYVMKDEAGVTSSAVVTMNITAVNDVPSFTKGADQTVAEDSGQKTASGWAADIYAGADNESGQVLDFVVTTTNSALFSVQPAVSPSGELTFTPAPDANGTAIVSVKLHDDGGTANSGVDTSASQSFTITVTPVNDNPGAIADSAATLEDTAKTIDVLVNDTDVDKNHEGDALRIDSVTQGTHGTVSIIEGGLKVVYTPGHDYNGGDSFTYIMKDAAGVTSSAVVTMNITAVNDIPSFTKGADQSVAEDCGMQTVSGWATGIYAGADNELGQELTFIVTTTNSALFSVQPAVSSSGELTFTPAPDANGTVAVSVKLQDNGGTANSGVDTSASQSFTITVTPVNDNPGAIADSAATLEDTAKTIDVLVNDTDVDESHEGDTLTIDSVTQGTHGTVSIIEGGLKVVYTPNGDYNGGDSFTYVMKDEAGVTASAVVTVNITAVNDVPSFTKGVDQTVAEDSGQKTVSDWAADIDAGADNESGQVLDFVVTTTNSALFSVQPAVSSSGELTFTPAPDANGTAIVSVKLHDDGGTANGGVDTSVSQSFTITVTPVNDNPGAIADSAATLEDTAKTIDVLANDTDVDESHEGDTLTIDSVTQGVHGTVVITEGGLKVVYTPNGDYNGGDSFTYVMKDANGVTASAVVTMNITAVNDVPSFTKGVDQTVDEDSGQKTVSDWAADIDAGADNESGQVLDFVVTTTNSALFSVQPAVSSSGELTFTPAPDANGTAIVSVKLHDDGGTANSGVDTSASQTFTITVTAVNDAPEANDDTAVTDEDTTVTINVLANDTDTDILTNGDSLTIDSITQGTHGTVSVTEGGLKVVYTPNGDFNGSDTFTYTVSDGNGGTDTATVTVTVGAVNDVPSFTKGGDQTVAEDSGQKTVPGWAADIYAGADNESGQVLDFVVTTTNSALFSVQPAVSSSGELTFTPAPDANGTAMVSVKIHDDGGTANSGVDTSASQTFTITITAVNDAPKANDDMAGTDEDTMVTINVLANDTDTDILTNGDSLTIDSVTQGSHGTVSVTEGGLKVVYTPNGDYNGSDSFTYTVSDGNGGTDTATVTITVGAVNDAPVANDDTASVDEDSHVSINVLANDSDLDGDGLTVSSVTQGTHGTVVITGGGLSVVYTPNGDYNGSDSFTYTVSDGNGGTDTATVTVTVGAVNDAPVANDDTASVNEDSSVQINVLSNDSDVDGDSLTVSAVTQGIHGTVTITGGGLGVAYAPNEDYNGSDTFTYTVSDGNGGTDTATVTVTVGAINDAPVANDDTASVDEDSLVSINVLANDSDLDGDSLTVSAVTQGTHGTVTITGGGLSIIYTPNGDYNGSDSFTYTVSDGNGGTDTATVTITVGAVNDAPVANDDTASVDEDSHVSINVLANDSDVDGDGLTVSAVTQGSHGTVTITGGGLSVVYTPNGDYNGSDSFTYTVSDGNGGTDTATVTVTVGAVNDAPVANDDTASVDEDSHVSINVLANDSDVDGDGLTVSSVTQGTHGTVVITGGGLSVVYTPNGDYNGSDSFTYTVSDGNGGTDTATVTVTVGAVNDAPVAIDDTASVNEDSSVQVNVLANDSDVDGDSLTVSAVIQGSHGTVVITGGGLSIIYTPNGDYNGSDSFTYTVSDGNGGTDTATVTITVGAVNDAPVANDDTASVDEDSHVSINVLANDSDVDGDSLTVSAVTQGSHGTVVITGGGLSVIYTPNGDYNGSDSFTYTVSDGKGGTDTATVTVTVGAVNDAPVAIDDTASVNEDSSVQVNVLANDSDLDGDSLTVSAVTQGTHGTVTITGSGLNIIYTPNGDYNGSDTFTYTVSDGKGGTDTATVTVTVGAVNDAPVANDDTASVNEDSSVQVNVLANDSDVDGDSLTVSAVTQGTHGTVTITGGGLNVIYTPNGDYNGSDSFTYTVSDGKGGTDTATVTVTVGAVNDAPVANDDTASVNEDSSVQVNVLVNDSDLDGDSLTVSAVTQGTHGTVTITGSGLNVIYTPDLSYHGSDSFRYTISDGKGATASAIVTVTIGAINDAPIANDDQAETDENTPIRINVLANDTDDDIATDGDSLTIITAGAITSGAVTIADDKKTLLYTPSADFIGTAVFYYDISDISGATASAIVTVTVSAITVPTVDLWGILTDKKSGALVSGAAVELSDWAGNVLKSYTTDATGQYHFDGLSADKYVISVTHDHYSDNKRQIQFAHSSVVGGKIREDFELSKFKVVLMSNPSSIVADGIEQTILTAMISDENGKPVTGAAVQFNARMDMGTFPSGSVAVTNDEGKASVVYRSTKIEAVYSIAVPVVATVSDPVREIYASDQIMVTFAPGKIRGIVTNSKNDPIQGALVTVKHYDSDGNVDFVATYTTGADGKYEIVIPKGDTEYQIEITKPVDILGGAEKTFVQKIKAGAVNGTGADLFDSEKTITGIIGIADINDTHKFNLVQNKQTELHMDVQDTAGGLISGAAVTINSDGIYNVTGLTTGEYVLALSYTFPDGREIVTNKVDLKVKQNGEIIISDILIDPYGTITDSNTGNVIGGVNVTLYYANTARNLAAGLTPGTAVALPAVANFPPADNANPQSSSASGNYAFMVFPQTDYYLVATKSQYKTYTSPTISVFNDIVHHSFSMTPLSAGGGIVGGGAGGVAAAPAAGEVLPSDTAGRDLAIALYSEKMKVAEDGEITFTAKYFNRSQFEIKDVIVTVKIPDEMKVTESGNGKEDAGTLQWNLGSLAVGAQGTLTFKLKASQIDSGEKMVLIHSLITSSEPLINTIDDSSKIQIMIYQVDYIGTHQWYILGYPDGEFKADRSLSRSEMAVIFARLLHLDVGDTGSSYFTDVDSLHWAYGYIQAMTRAGLMKGTGDGVFEPDRPVTRAELVVMLARYLDLERADQTKPAEVHFGDIADSWALGTIEEIYRYQVIKGYEDGSFQPDGAMRRDEAVALINRALYRGPITASEQTFPDISADYWAWGDIEESAYTHHYSNDSEGTEILIEIIQP